MPDEAGIAASARSAASSLRLLALAEVVTAVCLVLTASAAGRLTGSAGAVFVAFHAGVAAVFLVLASRVRNGRWVIAATAVLVVYAGLAMVAATLVLVLGNRVRVDVVPWYGAVTWLFCLGNSLVACTRLALRLRLRPATG